MARWVPAWTQEIRRQEAGTRAIVTEWLDLAGGTLGWAGPGSWANQALGVGLDGPVDDPVLDTLVAFYADRGADARIEVPPFAHPTLVSGLGRRGFVVQHFENVWLRALPPGEDLRAAVPGGWPAGIEARPITADEASLFVAISTSGFAPPGGSLSDADLALAFRMVRSPEVVSVLVSCDGQAAGAGSASVGQGSAGLFGASTLPAFRRRGVQQAGIAARLEAVRGRGATFACIESLPGIATERNARRMGFELAGTKVSLVRPR